MKSEYELGSIAGLRLSAQPSFFTDRFLFMVTLAILGRFVFKLSRPGALFGALVAVVLDAFVILFHGLGHAWMAKRAGWPMTGINFWGLFGTTIYPPDEPELPPSVHLRRAVGGPIASFLLGLLTGVPALWLAPKKGLARLLVLFWMGDTFGMRGIGALGPVSFSDGPTIRYWGKRLLAEREENRRTLNN
jgi:hypothetical protein